MRHTINRWICIAAGAVATLAVGAFAVTAGAGPGPTTDRAGAATPRFSNPGRIDNRYLPLTRRTRCELRGKADDGTSEQSVKTVLERTKSFTVAGRRVEAVVIQDNAYENGKLVETTLDYYAQADDGTVYYFGEQVKNLKNGKVINTNGTWLYGKDTDRLGVAMPARPTLGRQWHFEDVPGLTTESNRVEEVGLRVHPARGRRRVQALRGRHRLGGRVPARRSRRLRRLPLSALIVISSEARTVHDVPTTRRVP